MVPWLKYYAIYTRDPSLYPSRHPWPYRIVFLRCWFLKGYRHKNQTKMWKFMLKKGCGKGLHLFPQQILLLFIFIEQFTFSQILERVSRLKIWRKKSISWKLFGVSSKMCGILFHTLYWAAERKHLNSPHNICWSQVVYLNSQRGQYGVQLVWLSGQLLYHPDQRPKPC